MATKNIAWTRKDQLFPDGTLANGWSVAVTRVDDGTGQHQDVPVETTSVTFECAAGAWVASVVRMSPDGAQLGDVATANFVVEEGPVLVTISVADAVTVSDVIATADTVTA